MTATVPVGGNPQDIVLSPDGSTLYVPNSGSDTVSVISTATDTVTATISTGYGTAAAAVTPDGSMVYVANSAGNSVGAISTATNTVTSTISVGNGPMSLVTVGSQLYVANTFDGTVSVINTTTNTVTSTFTAGYYATWIAASADGSHLFLANSNDSVSVIDTSTDTVGASASVGGYPYDVTANSAGTLVYVANGSTLTVLGIATTAPAPTVTAISPATGLLSGGTTVTITGTGFTGATAVMFGSTAATSFAVNSATSITATSPATITPGPVDVTVTTPAGTSTTGSADQFSYHYAFTGFTSPVDNPPTLNQVNGGQAIPMKWSLGGNQGLNVIASGYPTATQVNCSTSAPVNTSTLTDTAGGSGLQYDASSGTYTYVWKTAKAYSGTCQQFTLKLTDGTTHTADFEFK